MYGHSLEILSALLLVFASVLAAPAAAQDKDTLVIALDTLGAQVMDPIADTRAPHAHYHAPVWDSLVGFDLEKGGIGPGVAEKWERAADGKSWTFSLRKGLKFHNGDPLTAHDVKFSLERKMSPESIASGAAALRRAVERIEVLDDHTVRVHTKGVLPHFAASLSRAVFMEGTVMPKKYIETVGAKGFRDKPIGSGPWKFVRNVPGDRIEYEAVPGHWRGTPQFKKMTLLLVPEQSTRLAMVRTGEASIVAIGPDAIKEAQSGGMKIVTVPGTMQAVYQFWGTYKPEAKGSPLADTRVLTVPFGVRDGFRERGALQHGSLYAQIRFPHAIAGGFLARIPPYTWTWYETTEPFRSLLELSDARSPVPIPACTDIAAGLRTAAVTHLVLDRTAASASLTEFVERFPLRHLEQPCRFGLDLADRERRGRVHVQSLDPYADVDADDVAVVQHPFVGRNPMHDFLIDRRAQRGGKVVQALERGLRARMAANELLGETVQVFGGDVGADVASDQRQRLREDPAGRRHRLDFPRRLDGDHRPMIRLISPAMVSTVPVPGTRCTMPRCA